VLPFKKTCVPLATNTIAHGPRIKITCLSTLIECHTHVGTNHVILDQTTLTVMPIHFLLSHEGPIRPAHALERCHHLTSRCFASRAASKALFFFAHWRLIFSMIIAMYSFLFTSAASITVAQLWSGSVFVFGGSGIFAWGNGYE